MRESLCAGITGTFRYRVPLAKTVPHIYEEAPDFQLMPRVLATGYLVALCEWAAIEVLKPHLDWPREQSLGTRVDLTHLAATPPGFTVEVTATVIEVTGRKVVFAIRAVDDAETISEGTHERHVIDAARFNAKVDEKSRAAT